MKLKEKYYRKREEELFQKTIRPEETGFDEFKDTLEKFDFTKDLDELLEIIDFLNIRDKTYDPKDLSKTYNIIFDKKKASRRHLFFLYMQLSGQRHSNLREKIFPYYPHTIKDSDNYCYTGRNHIHKNIL